MCVSLTLSGPLIQQRTDCRWSLLTLTVIPVLFREMPLLFHSVRIECIPIETFEFWSSSAAGWSNFTKKIRMFLEHNSYDSWFHRFQWFKWWPTSEQNSQKRENLTLDVPDRPYKADLSIFQILNFKIEFQVFERNTVGRSFPIFLFERRFFKILIQHYARAHWINNQSRCTHTSGLRSGSVIQRSV